MTQPSSDPTSTSDAIVPSRAQLAQNLGLPYVPPSQPTASFFNANGDPKLMQRAAKEEVDPGTEPIDPERAFALEVQKELRRLEVREEARRQFRAGQFIEPPDDALPITLEDLEQEPPVIEEWRVHELWPLGTLAIIEAMQKAGKTTFVVNTIKAFADGEPLLGEHPVRQVEGTCIWIDLEQTRNRGRLMLQARNIQNKKKVVYWNLANRGFDIMNDSWAEWFVKGLRKFDAEVVFAETLRQLFTLKSANDDIEMRTFFSRWGMILGEAGVSCNLMSVHAGWDALNPTSEIRSKGSSGIEADPASIWTLGWNAKVSFFKPKFVRGMDLTALPDERALAYDKTTETLTYDSAKAGLTRATAPASQLEDELFEEISNNPGATGNQLGIVGRAAQDKKIARDRLKKQGKIVIVDGPRGAHLHYVAGCQPPGAKLIP